MKGITTEEIMNFTSPLLGKEISRVWQGHGSAIFLEVGELTENKGELTIMIEWSWRVEKGNKISFGSWSEESEFPQLLETLKGLTLRNISFQTRLLEVVVELSNDIWVCSFSTVAGDPEWALITPTKTMLSSNGVLGFE